jgi:thiamine pyrophosphate-dependent acetolactate synthase large subunit-like protein
LESLYNAGARLVLGILGAKVDSIFNASVENPKIRLTVCQYKQNAAFMVAIVARLTGCPEVSIDTSGPGTSNLTNKPRKSDY